MNFCPLLSTHNVNFARNVEWDFFCDFQTPCTSLISLLFLLCDHWVSLLCGFLQLPQFGAGWRQENRKCAEFLTTPKRTTCIFRSLSTPVYGLGTQPKSEIDLFAINYPSSDREPNEFLSWCFRETCQICETGTTFDRCLRSLASPIRFTFNWEDPLNAVISPKSKWK